MNIHVHTYTPARAYACDTKLLHENGSHVNNNDTKIFNIIKSNSIAGLRAYLFPNCY